MRIRVEQRIGQVFGNLVIVGIAEKRGQQYIMECKCSCGKTCLKWLSMLIDGRAVDCLQCHGPRGMTDKSCVICGAVFRGRASAKRSTCSSECSTKYRSESNRSHGDSGTRLHDIWCHMKTRCSLPTHAAFKYYGGRGISICLEWVNSYETFRNWALASGYEETLEIDRINTNGNYEPSNCRWANRTQQMQNTRKRRGAKTSRFKGVSKHSQNGNWVAQLHANGKPINCGSHNTELAAAFAYDDAAAKLYGEFAHFNFPERQRAIARRSQQVA